MLKSHLSSQEIEFHFATVLQSLRIVRFGRGRTSREIWLYSMQPSIAVAASLCAVLADNSEGRLGKAYMQLSLAIVSVSPPDASGKRDDSAWGTVVEAYQRLSETAAGRVPAWLLENDIA